jgi:hypothetical protein
MQKPRFRAFFMGLSGAPAHSHMAMPKPCKMAAGAYRSCRILIADDQVEPIQRSLWLRTAEYYVPLRTDQSSRPRGKVIVFAGQIDFFSCPRDHRQNRLANGARVLSAKKSRNRKVAGKNGFASLTVMLRTVDQQVLPIIPAARPRPGWIAVTSSIDAFAPSKILQQFRRIQDSPAADANFDRCESIRLAQQRHSGKAQPFPGRGRLTVAGDP